MASYENKIHQNSLSALNNMLADLQPIIDQHTAQMSPDVANYLLTNYAKYLKINLQPDIQKRQTVPDYASPFDQLIEDYHNDDGLQCGSTNV